MTGVELGWIASQRLYGTGEIGPCRGTNCGGYTFEAQLGIIPNGRAEPMDILTKAERSARMRLIRSKDSKFELRVRSAVHRLGYRFRKHVATLPGKPDMVFASRRRIIFVNGCYWHGHTCRLARMPKSNSAYWAAKIETNKACDARHRSDLRRTGWKILTVWECQRNDFAAVVRRIQHFLERPH